MAKREELLADLALALQARFEEAGARADIELVIKIFSEISESVGAADPSWPRYMSNLANALRIRSERYGAQADLDEAISVGRAALAVVPAGWSGEAATRSNLGAALRARYERGGDPASLDEAIDEGRAAVAAAGAGDESRIGYQANLGAALRARFELSGVRADLDEAIAAGRAAVGAAHPGYPHRAACLANLGAALKVSFEYFGARADLDEAIVRCQAAVAAGGPDHPGRPVMLSNLGTVLQARYTRTGELADLDDAIVTGRAAVDAAGSDHPGRAGYLSNLSAAYQARFDHLGTLADLDNAAAISRQAVQACEPDHPGRAGYLSNLSAALVIRHSHTGEQHDVDEAIAAGYAAIAAASADQPRRARYLSNLTGALTARYELTRAPADQQAAFAAAAEAAGIGAAPPSVRVPAARAAALLAAQSAPQDAAELLELGVRLLPEITPRRLGRSDQQAMLATVAGLAGEAAAMALEAASGQDADAGEGAVRALRLLEAGRAVLLGQLLDTRGDLSDLRERDAALAGRFEGLRDQLDQDDDGRFAQAPGPAPRRQLAAEFASVTEQIRALDGFADFALPPPAADLLAEAEYGPIAAFNVSMYRSDALLLTSSGITSLVLPELSHREVASRVSLFRAALAAIDRHGAASARGMAAQRRMSAVLAWLWDSALGPVLDVLGYRHAPSDGILPRLWLVPGGLLSMLPIHAAGHHDDPPGQPMRRTVMDRVIPSYTPTVRALRHARAKPHPRGEPMRSLVVAMPATPGMPGRLRYAAAEAEAVAGALPEPTVLLSSVTKADVLRELPHCTIAHFACHGASHPQDPSASQLLLSDHAADPLTVASLAPIILDRAQFAYLAACRTAYTPATKLIDEAIDLASAFQLAGFPHVVGTAWEIDDAISVQVAAAVYAGMRDPAGTIDPARAAVALHDAVRTMRDELSDLPFLWAGYVYAGA